MIKYTTLATLSLLATTAFAQSYPNKPVTLVLGYAAGGPTDTVTRIVSDVLGKKWGVPVIIENKPGATATIATAQVAKAKPDGYTLLVIANDFIASRFTYSKLPYDPVKDITPIGLLSVTPNVLVTSASAGYRSYADFQKDYKIKHGSWSYSSTGIGSTSHIAAEVYAARIGGQSNHVPYKGFSTSLPDLITGRINFAIPSLSSVQSQLGSAGLVPLAVAGQKRSVFLPNVPTFDEVGIKDFNIRTWYGLAAAAGVSGDIIQKLSADLNAVLQDPAVVKKINDQGSEVSAVSPAQFQKMIAEEMIPTQELLKNVRIN